MKQKITKEAGNTCTGVCFAKRNIKFQRQHGRLASFHRAMNQAPAMQGSRPQLRSRPIYRAIGGRQRRLIMK
jgi:hypothetical protein